MNKNTILVGVIVMTSVLLLFACETGNLPPAEEALATEAPAEEALATEAPAEEALATEAPAEESLDGNVGSNGDSVQAISFGDTVDGQISSSGQRFRYVFKGSNTTVVTIRMKKISSGLDPYIELYDPAGHLVAQDDDSAGDYNSLISAYGLRNNGTYTIVARAYGNETGRFQLSLSAR